MGMLCLFGIIRGNLSVVIGDHLGGVPGVSVESCVECCAASIWVGDMVWEGEIVWLVEIDWV
jgi:hypothetical protein